jgi:hypothetical protein
MSRDPGRRDRVTKYESWKTPPPRSRPALKRLRVSRVSERSSRTSEVGDRLDRALPDGDLLVELGVIRG